LKDFRMTIPVQAAFASRPCDGTSVCLAIATIGRAEVLKEILSRIAWQTRLPEAIVICHTRGSDIAGVTQADLPQGVPTSFFTSPAGLPKQRNAILDAVQSSDIVLFIDDDFLMAPRYIEAVAATMASNPAIVATTGELIADDTRGPGLTVAQGEQLIGTDTASASALCTAWREAPHGYGCNMALRLATIRAHDLRFDENLPLYAWSEDIDFTHRIKKYGTIAKLAGARGVHLGVKQARSPGRRLGYSQVANPVYLLRKGSYSPGRAGRSVARNMAANITRAIFPEPYIDRRGRLIGNAMALIDLCRGKLRPDRILEF
jgi:glycosyltransferase involved in cell wall biosynthesis